MWLKVAWPSRTMQRHITSGTTKESTGGVDSSSHLSHYLSQSNQLLMREYWTGGFDVVADQCVIKCSVPVVEEVGERVLIFQLVWSFLAVFCFGFYCGFNARRCLSFQTQLHLLQAESLQAGLTLLDAGHGVNTSSELYLGWWKTFKQKFTSLNNANFYWLNTVVTYFPLPLWCNGYRSCRSVCKIVVWILGRNIWEDLSLLSEILCAALEYLTLGSLFTERWKTRKDRRSIKQACDTIAFIS